MDTMHVLFASRLRAEWPKGGDWTDPSKMQKNLEELELIRSTNAESQWRIEMSHLVISTLR